MHFHPLPPRSLIAVVAFAAQIALHAQTNPHRDVAIEDLVRASGGRLAIHARNLSHPEAVLSLNAIGERQLGTLPRLIVAGAVMARAREAGTSLETTLPYPKEAYRGRSGVLGERHDEQFSLQTLIDAMIRADDPAATDLLIQWVQGELPGFHERLGLKGLRPLSRHRDRDRYVLRRIDPRFAKVSDRSLQSWLRDRNRSAIVPSHFAADPRRRDDYVRALGAAWEDWYAERRDAAPLQSFADAVVTLLRKEGVLHESDRATLSRTLQGVPRAASARDLGLHLPVFGWDATGWRRQAAAGLIETRRGTIVVVAHARGFASADEARHLLSRLIESAVRRLAPGAWKPPAPQPLPESLPRTLRRITLLDGEGGQRTDFDVGEAAHVRIETAATEPAVVSIRWLFPDGGRDRESRALTPGAFADVRFEQRLRRSGRYTVEIAIGQSIVQRLSFQVRK